MTPFFNSIERILRLESIAESWKGTPFMPNASIKGAGVSCQKLVGEIYIETGFIPATFEIPEGPMDWSNAHTDSLITAFMRTQTKLFVEVAQPLSSRAGDMIGIKLGGCVQHCGVVINIEGKFIHCLRGHGTTFSNVRDASYLKRIENVWRPAEPVNSQLEIRNP